MKPRSIMTIGPSTLLTLRGLCRTSLLAVILLVGCAPATPPAPVEPEAFPQPAPLENEPPAVAPTESQPQAASTEIPPTQAPTEIPQIAATSRGPNLEATDPSTVSLASGDLQLVEFFRFT